MVDGNKFLQEVVILCINVDVLNIINVLEMYLWFTFSPRKQTHYVLVIIQHGEVNLKFVNFAPPALLFGIIFLTLHC